MTCVPSFRAWPCVAVLTVFGVTAIGPSAYGGVGETRGAAAPEVGVAATPDSDYETPPVLNASDLLPDYLQSGAVFTVDPAVRNDGRTNHYTVRSPHGDMDAAGRAELERVIQEIRAIEYLRGHRKRTGAVVGFNQGMKKVVTAPYHSVKRVAFNPLYAIEAVPSEIADYAGKIATVGDLFKYGPRVFVRRSLGIDGARDDLADRLHVDEKTDNVALRQEINRVGWGVWMGGLVPNIGEGYLDLSLDLSTEVGDLGDGNLGRAVSAVRREVFPRSARRILRKMDVPEDLVQAFREHPHFSGRMRENLALALSTLDTTERRDAYVAWAMGAASDEEARQMVRLSQVLAVHHATVGPITQLHHGEGVLLLEHAGDSVVTPLVYDYLIWSAESDRLLTAAAALQAEVAPGAGQAVWSLGGLSPRLHGVLAERGYEVRTHVGDDYGAFERPRKGMKRLEQRYERRVEDPLRERVRGELDLPRTERLVLEPLGPDSGAEAAVTGAALAPPLVRSPDRAPSVARVQHGHPNGYPVREVVRKRLFLDQK